MSEELLTIEESEAGTAVRRTVRRRTRDVFYGVVLYLFMFTALQYVLYAEYGLLAALMGGVLPEEPSDFFYGVIILISTAAALTMGWLYFAGKAERGALFTGPAVTREILARRERLPFISLLGCIGLVFLLQIMFSFVIEAFELLFNRFGYTLQYSEAMNADYATSWTLLVYAVLIGPLAEEIMYRGFLMRGLEPNGRAFALVTSAFVFGMMHGDFQQTMFTMAVGLLFAYVAMRYSLWYALALHIFNNGILGELWVWMIGRMTDEVYVIVIAVLLILSVIGTVVLFRRHGKEAFSWLGEDETKPGAWKSLINFWFVLFLVFSVTEIVYSISPL